MTVEEIVARALCKLDEYDPDELGSHFGGGLLWTQYEDDARAALRALEEQGYAVVPREPTEAMVRAAMDEWHEDKNTVYLHVLMRDCWRAMLNAADVPLAEPLAGKKKAALTGGSK